MYGRWNFSTVALFLFATGIALMSADAMAAGEVQAVASAGTAESSRIFLSLTAMGSVGISCMTSAYALARIGTAAMGAMSEKPEIGGRALIFLGMAEGIAIYGLIVAIMILNKIE